MIYIKDNVSELVVSMVPCT